MGSSNLNHYSVVNIEGEKKFLVAMVVRISTAFLKPYLGGGTKGFVLPYSRTHLEIPHHYRGTVSEGASKGMKMFVD